MKSMIYIAASVAERSGQAKLKRRRQIGLPITHMQPHASLLPLLQAPPAGRGRRKFVAQKSPRRASFQYPKNS
ncbi:MAG: hypothetical protein ABR991_04385, partial [Terracidiphilus sp.]